MATLARGSCKLSLTSGTRLLCTCVQAVYAASAHGQRTSTRYTGIQTAQPVYRYTGIQRVYRYTARSGIQTVYRYTEVFRYTGVHQPVCGKAGIQVYRHPSEPPNPRSSQRATGASVRVPHTCVRVLQGPVAPQGDALHGEPVQEGAWYLLWAASSSAATMRCGRR